MSKDIILNWARENALEITPAQLDKLAAFQARVLDINQHMNLTAITDPADFAIKHIIDSLTLLPYIPENARLVDIGSGAGFPGMVLKIMRENLQLTLLDSLRKRVNFLHETAETLGFPSIECIHARAEDHAKTHANFYDITTARAVASMDKLAAWALPLTKSGGSFLAMKGPQIQAELEKSKPAIQKYGGQIEKIALVELTPDLSHSIVVVRKN
jgi:16S rRNA (guanine527-N7)-methyltransferase